MADTTPILGLPYPELGDEANIETFGVKPLAMALEPGAWQTITIVRANFPSSSLAYYKDALGIVHLRSDSHGPTSGGSVSAGSIGTMPAGVRPGTKQWFMAVTQDPSTVSVPFSITTAGVIAFEQAIPVGYLVAFDAHYRAEN